MKRSLFRKKAISFKLSLWQRWKSLAGELLFFLYFFLKKSSHFWRLVGGFENSRCHNTKHVVVETITSDMMRVLTHMLTPR